MGRAMHRETLWGSEPGQEVTKDGSHVGDFPSVDEIVAKVKSTLSK